MPIYKLGASMNRVRTGRRSAFGRGGFNKKWFFIAGGILLVIIIAVLLLFTDVFGSSDPFLRMGLNANTQISIVGPKSLYYLNGNTLYKADKSGKIAWNSKFSSGDMSLSAGEQVICLFNTQTATVLDENKNPLYNIPESDNFQITEVVCGKTSIALLCTRTDDVSQYIRIFSKDGVELDQVKIEASHVMKMGFYGDADSFWYYMLDTTGVEPISRVVTTVPSQRNVTGLYATHGQLVSDVCLFGTDIYITDSHYVTAYDTFKKVISKTLIYGNKLADCLVTKDDVILAYVPVSSIDTFINTVRIITRKGSDTLIQLPTGIQNVAVSTKYIYCFAKDTIYLYNYEGNYEKAYALDFEITSFKKASDFMVLLGNEDELLLYTLR